MPLPMSDVTDADVLNRLACVRGHLKATIQMVEHGDQDLAIVHQLHAVRGALLKIQVEVLRAQFDYWASRPTEWRALESALAELVKIRKQKP